MLWNANALLKTGVSDYVKFSNVARGLYVNQLKTWIGKIPRERFLILKSETLFSEPDKTLPKALNFIGLPSDGVQSFPKENTILSYDLGLPALNEETRALLREFYVPYDDQLSRFLGLDLENWV